MNPDPLIEQVAGMAALALHDTVRDEGPLTLDRVAHFFTAAIEAYEMFRDNPPVSPSAN